MKHDPHAAMFSQLRESLLAHLLNSVVPFWLKHAIDAEGGLNTCIRDDGSIVSRDKWLWSQWRAVWVFSRLYRRIGQRPEWLDLATNIYKFAARHGWDAQARGWRLRLAHDGSELAGCDSIYVDGFAIYGLTEYAAATGDKAALALARRTAEGVIEKLGQPHDKIKMWPYPAPAGCRVHGLAMIFSLVLWELGRACGEQRYLDAAEAMSDEIFGKFYRPSRGLLLERIADDGRELPAPLGTAVVPGHVIEDMWFQIHIARDRGDNGRIMQACDIIRRHIEAGWDHSYGGLLLAIDADGSDDIGWDFADTKLWWPQTEAMYALLLAYEHCRQEWCVQWFQKVHDYCFAHYPVTPHGEWRQKLDRFGKPFESTVALPVKDPFHLPRALIYCIDVLDRLV
ncbi:MAG: hypothetical protein GXY38_10795 [Planctomycetes bacterium]|nr:hypothetical protein [Planctomycetota bacterium]